HREDYDNDWESHKEEFIEATEAAKVEFLKVLMGTRDKVEEYTESLKDKDQKAAAEARAEISKTQSKLDDAGDAWLGKATTAAKALVKNVAGIYGNAKGKNAKLTLREKRLLTLVKKRRMKCSI